MAQTRLLELIAPSGYAPDAEVAQRGIGVLQGLGFSVRNAQAIERRYLRFAGTDDERAAELNQYAGRGHPLPEVVLAVRGGYGAVHLLGKLDYEGLHRRLSGSPVVLCGHSDFTAVQLALLARAHVTTFAGPMLLADFGADDISDFTLSNFQAVLNAPEHTVQWETDDAGGPTVSAAGTLWGGNLAMLCSLLGTPYFPKVDGGILFVEDVNEPPFRVERMLYQLHLAGVLKRQKALVLGQFTEYRLSDYDNGYDFGPMVEHVRGLVGIPIVTGLPFGHTPDKLTLPVGGYAELQSGGTQATMRLSQYPYRSA
ncbi:muramoyltetrapeptide carboxypeptidase [Pandoraea terrae]|uniref:Muramoyltetrapeptide carboxypeptidase n=1 Tax=Pandoraea terrae TaxID=1537710 RepID=A0A5E4WN79_9BURK|nr:muramoyltetrapeptide carboxypeptidase [Pandoraea terrae]VVE25991.1 muramoyltetrapeptide carboxypeptidase [Pandoraea terrae]